MKVVCPVCNGKGRIPIQSNAPMGYYNPITGDSFPMKVCPGCNGSGVQEK